MLISFQTKKKTYKTQVYTGIEYLRELYIPPLKQPANDLEATEGLTRETGGISTVWGPLNLMVDLNVKEVK